MADSPLSLVAGLPRLGVGISTEFGTRPTIDPSRFAAEHPGLVHFVEFGSDLDRGLDPFILSWVGAGGRATYHFLDLNLEEPADQDEAWISGTGALARRLRAPWVCGDSGLWHFGPRDRAHGLLLPPILDRESAAHTAESVARLQEALGIPVLPENPPSLHWLGDLHVLDYFALVGERAGSPLLLDLAHLAIYQRARGLPATAGLDGFPLERVVEIHVAGTGEMTTPDGYRYLEDDHRAELLPEVWELVETVIPRAPSLKALVYECEHNPEAEVLPTFRRLNALFPAGGPDA
jgi:uncharacterized protein (UPF0276 family)